MAYPNSSSYNIVIAQTTTSAVLPGQFPFIERIISGSNLVLQTDTNGLLVGAPLGYTPAVTASIISASTAYIGTLTASIISASTSIITNALTASNISASGTIVGLTISGSSISASNISASGTSNFNTVSSSNEYISNTLYGNTISASNISASGTIRANAFSGSLNGTASNAVSSSVAISSSYAYSSSAATSASNAVQALSSSTIIVTNYSTASSQVMYPVFVDSQSGAVIARTDSASLSYNPGTNELTLSGNFTVTNISASYVSSSTLTSSAVYVNNLSASSYISTSLLTVKSTSSLDGPVRINDTTQTTDHTIGALIVAGGVGIGKNLYVSGSTTIVGDLTILGASSVVNISSSTVNIDDNIILLNAFAPYQRYAGISMYDSASAVSASLLWDGTNDYFISVDVNNSSSKVIGGPLATFGGTDASLTSNVIPKAYSGNGITDSKLTDDGTTLRYSGSAISASQLTASSLFIVNEFVTNLTSSNISASGQISASNLWAANTASVPYVSSSNIVAASGSFTTITVVTGSSPGTGSQVPVHPTASGIPGQIEVDNNFIYVYTNNAWKRVPLSVWSL